VKRVVPITGFGIFHFAGRLLLTIVTVFAFLCALVMLMKIHAMFLASQEPLSNHPLYVGNNIRPASSASVVHPFWPEFPRNSTEKLQSAVINGVQILTEEWESSAAASDILSFYHEQMIARGWQDVTEDAYGIQPESHEAANASQDERYVSNYRKIMDSKLVVTRGDWSMHLSAEPDKVDFRKTAVKIYAAETSSIMDFFAGMESALAKNPRQSDHPLDAVQQSGGERYHTTIVAKNETPAQAFQEALAKVGTQGWRPVMLLPKQQTQSGYFAWLVRGKDYAALSVKASPQGQGSSVTLTEVTPESGQNR